MRYYQFALNINSEKIRERIKENNLKEYVFDDPIAAVNGYMYRNLKKDVLFIIYREEGCLGYATFAYSERIYSFRYAYKHVLEILDGVFLIDRIAEEPAEITMFRYYDCYEEARRRGLTTGRSILDMDNWFYSSYYSHSGKRGGFDFSERIVAETDAYEHSMCDESLLRELDTVRRHEVPKEQPCNMVHYFVSARSSEASGEIIGTLMQGLLDANRITSRRLEMIGEIDPYSFRFNSHLEDIIENSYGGVIAIDLSSKIEYEPTRYETACRYIEKIFKKYRNKCLFIFTYNMDDPGFSYYLLPEIKKYVMPVTIKEGSGDRKKAVSYMKHLIKGSEYAKYANQAGEFMKFIPGEEFTQTDVLMAYERFEAWCVNRNILHAYEFDFSEGFMLDREPMGESSYDKLQRLIGLKTVKKQIDRVIATNIVDLERKRRRGRDYKSGTMHMVFAGNPGNAKTTVAELFAGIAKEKGILKSGAFVVRGGMDLDGIFCEQTIREAFKAAKGGVLFVDEAYSLWSDTATTVLIQELEEHREDVIVVFAGYSERMKEFMEQNEGLKSRVPYWINFPDYSVDELSEIFDLMTEERGFCVTKEAREEARYIFEKARLVDGFGNGRYVRNLIDQAVMHQSSRLLSAGVDVKDVRKNKLFQLVKADIFEEGGEVKEERLPGAAKAELDELVGLFSAKETISKVLASFRMNKLCIERGMKRERASLHMVFTGNPGTAKTTVARLFAEILKDEKVLPNGRFVELGRADLVGQFVGQTAPLVKKRFREAQGGVLFIDEAYSLCDNQENGYGDEAINTIVQEMENHRDDIVVIFAGYPKQMKEFLDRNPGMKSRIAFQIEFEDYSSDELCEITGLMASKKHLNITENAMEKLKVNYDIARKEKGYGNGRYVRKTLEEAEMNLAQRIMKLKNADISDEDISTIDECDIPEIKSAELTSRQIGFAIL